MRHFVQSLFRDEIHEPDVGVGRDICEIERAVVARKRRAADVHILIRDYKHLVVLSRLRIEEIDGSLAYEQQVTIIIEPNGPIAEIS